MEPAQAQIDQQLAVEVETSSLLVADSPRISGENPEHVKALTVAQTPLPPIIVHRATMRVIDGLHRLRAAELRGQDKIAVKFFDGDEADAFVLAVESNIAHGLPLSLADRKRAAGRIIASHSQWSDRMIASVTGIAPGTVADIRRRVLGDEAAEESRIGQDGRLRPVNGAEGRRIAGEVIAENPGLSLRQIARVAGISPETARDVRNRMSRGEDPLPKPYRRERRNRDPSRTTGQDKSHQVRGHQDKAQDKSHDSGPVRPRNGFGAGAVPGRTPVQDRTAVVERLKTDPALRFSETGRTLLRLLTIHTINETEWEEIIENVPPHCSDIVAQLASECAGVWAEFALRVERRVAQSV